MAKKDKKSKTAEKKARIAQKQEKKAAQKDKKAKGKPSKDADSDADDLDIDEVLAEYARKQELFLKVTEAVCEPPSPRGSATLIASPANDSELYLFGGEYFNGALASFYNDLFVYHINRDEWKIVTSPNSPLPRSGHAWCRGGNTRAVFLFGGEFSSPKQGTFYHYNDFWRLDPSSREWTRLETKKGPPARSGHRITYFKQYIILFGGFQDTSQQTKYLQDLWIYDCNSFQWHSPVLPPASAKPDARSSFSFLPHENGAVLYGGYSRVKATAVGKATKGGGGAVRAVLKPMVHQDCWFLRIIPPPADSAPNALPKVHWEKRKKAANSPNPPRAGTTMAYHKGRGISFGGVHDVEESEEGIDSEFFNQAFVWNIDRNRFFPLTLRRARPQPKRAAMGERGKRGRGKADEEDLLKNLAKIEMRGAGGSEGVDDDDEELSKLIAKEEHEPEKPEKPVMFEMPHPRFNAQLAVQDDALYIYGGTFEKGDREYTFDEMWTIDLGKLDGVQEIFKREVEDWQGSEDEDSDDEGDDEDGDGEEEEDGSENEAEIVQPPSAVDPVDMDQPAAVPLDEEEPPSVTTEADQEDPESQTSDPRPYPRPFESLREFYARSGIQWQQIIVDELARMSGGADKTIKEIRKIAFERAEERWWDCREDVTKIEDEQMEAGIGEVVSLADKSEGPQVGGVGRRR